MLHLNVMAYHLDKSIVKGWIENTSPGITKGALEILGVTRPIKLILRGNCWRDLAGTRIDFTNPDPKPQPKIAEAIHYLQRGVVGDITASRKNRIPSIPEDEIHDYLEKKLPIPSTWKNTLYIEWFSLVNGRIVIETSNFDIKISTHQWELDKAGEAKQRKDNALAMEHFMELMLTASQAQSEVDESDGEVDEFEWEKRLRVRDTLEEAAWFLGEGPAEPLVETFEIEDTSIKNRHQIVQYAYLVQNKTIELLGNSILDDGPRGDLALSIGYIFDSIEEAWPTKELELENGYRVAVLKRTIEASNTAIAAASTLTLENNRYEELRNLIFQLRDQMIDLSHELREPEQPPQNPI